MAKLSSTHIYGDLYVDGTISGALSGNASTATTLQTARTINGTSFNGSANITTANWGTSRTITIGSTGKSVNGSGNVSWTLDEIGAQSIKRSINFQADHTSNWTSSSAMSGLTYAGGWHGAVGSDGYLSFGNSGSNIVHMFIDGEYYAKENKKVYHEGNKPTPADIGAAAASHGTHLILGTGSGNAYRGDYGNTAYTHSQAAHAPSNAQKNSDITKAEIEAKLTGNITSHNHSGTYAAASHGNHVPTTQTANNAVFLRNDNTWQTVTPANIGAAAASHGTHLTIGTGSGNAAAGNHGHTFFDVKGNDTITSTGSDTTANWGSHGNSVHFYTKTGQLIDQPSQWGYILNIGKPNEVHQIWMTQASGDLYHRGGNASGWSGTWRKILDSANYGSHTHSYLPLSGGTLTGPVTVSGESIFHKGTYSDPWSGTGCCIKGTGNIGITGALRANGGVATLTATNGVATSDGATYVANLRYANSRGYCDLGSNTIPGRLYIRSGQGSAGSGVCVECAVTNGYAYVQYLSPEAGTIALTNHLSDRTKKENIVYVGSKDSEFTNKDFYDFIRDDLGLATYNYNEEYSTTDTHTKLNFIAQDILYDIENNCENKVGNLIVQTENAMRTQGNLRYDPEIYTSVIAGALKESINKIEELEDKNKKLEERLAMLEEKFSALENK